MLLVRDHTYRTPGLHNNHKVIITKHRRLCSLFLKFHWLLPNPHPSLSPAFTASSLSPCVFPCPPNSALSSSVRSKFSYSLTASSLSPCVFPCPPNPTLSSSVRSKFSHSLMQNTSASLFILWASPTVRPHVCASTHFSKAVPSRKILAPAFKLIPFYIFMLTLTEISQGM